MLLCNREKETLSFLNEYGQVTKQQLQEICKTSNKNIENLKRNGLAVEKDDIVMAKGVKEIDYKLLMCLDLLKYFLLNTHDIQWHTRASFPFYITLYRNNKVFDITAVLPGEEGLMTTALNRTQSDRLLVVAPNLKQPLQINKPVRYYIPEQQAIFSVNNGAFITDKQLAANN